MPIRIDRTPAASAAHARPAHAVASIVGRRVGQHLSPLLAARFVVRLAVTLATATAFLPTAASAQGAPLHVFACEPEWAALVKALEPEAHVTSATHLRQDPHYIEARPALIAQLRGADLAVCTGASLEAGWLPMLQERAGNPRVQDGEPGMFFASEAVKLIDADPAAAHAGPFAGDVHPEGNPHVQFDPQRMLVVAQALARRLEQIAPASASAIAGNLRRFSERWRARIGEWEQRAEALRGTRVAAQHSTFAYLWHWLGIEQVADLEPRPGMPPTPAHLRRLLETFGSAPPAAIVVASYHDARSARWLAGQLGGGLEPIVLSTTVEDASQPDALFDWMDGVIDALVTKARGAASAR